VGDARPGDGRRRLDHVLVQQGWFASRQRAQAAIMAGCVYVDGKRVDKAGFLVPPGAVIEVREDPVPFVSRGGLKLAHALDVFGLDVAGLVGMDVGASTGGFTDCLLQRGAARVYAVDVGYGQLHWRLRQDPRVVVMERVNARYLTPADIPEPLDFVVIDVSFISLRLILPPVGALLKPGGWGVALVKPQFEAGREDVGKGGVVREPRVHVRVLLDLLHQWPAPQLTPVGLTASPIAGPKGNREFLLVFRRQEAEDPNGGPADWTETVERVVAEVHGRAEAGE